MSRSQNQLRRHYTECLVERQEMLDWISRAQEITHVLVEKRDWLLWGHLRPEVWLQEALYARHHEEEVMEEADWDVYYIEEDEDWQREYELLEREEDYTLEDSFVEFAGRIYPREHIEDVWDRLGVHLG